MESDEENNTVNGRYPEYGAIFMSNRATKNECFSRKLFGLPAGEGKFVKQVKTGMLLFLFEFEKRELYGVFQASCDGAMDIVPSAYKKSGHKFPAQVKFNRIWHCHPLSEAEFGDAIKKNYFSRWKFNRGLSKVQVQRLLILFSSRIIKSQHPQRALATKSVDTEDVEGELGDSKLASDKVANMHKWDNKLGSIISCGYADDDKLASDKMSNLQNRDNEVGSIMSNRHLEDLPGNKVGRCDAKFAVVESVGNELNVDVEPGALTSIGFELGQNGCDDGKRGSGGIVCCAGTPLCSGIPIQETDSSVQDQSRQASSPSHKMELPITSNSYIASSAEVVVTGTLPYEPDNPGLNRPCSPSIGGNHNFIQDTDGHNGILSMRNQSQDNISEVNVPVSHSVINYIPLPGEASNAEMEIDSSKSLAPESLSEFGSNASESKSPSSYPLSPSNYPSFVVNPDHSVPLQNTLVHEVAPFTANITTSTEVQCKLQGQTLNGDHQSMDHHEHKCLDLKIFEGRLCSDLMENKGSVFSRLSLISDAYVEDNTTHTDHEKNVDFTLVDEVMAMLNECRCERLCGDLEKLKAQKVVQSELEKIPKRFNMALAMPPEHEVGQQRDEIPFLDFKRRSQLRRVNCATNDESAESEGLLGGQCKRSATNDESAGREGLLGGQCKRSATNDESAGSEGLLGGQLKRRKLIRPNFRNNEPCDNKMSTGNCLMKSVKSLQSIQECSSCEAADGKTRKLIWSDMRENDSSQSLPPECSIGEDADGKRRKRTRPNLSENGSSQVSSSIGEVAGGERKKLSRPNSRESKLPQVSSPQCSTGESCESFVGSQGKLFSEGAEFLNENEKVDTEMLPKHERDIIFNPVGSPRIRDDGGVEDLHDNKSFTGASDLKLQVSVDEPSSCKNGKKGKLVMSIFLENELSEESPHEWSSGEDAGGSNEALVGSNDKMYTSRFPTSEIESKPESIGESLESGDDSQIGIIPCKDKFLNAQEISDHQDFMVIKLSPVCTENSLCTVPESAIQLKTNTEIQTGFSEIENDRGSELELLPGFEHSPNIGGRGGSRNQSSKSQRVAEEVSDCADMGLVSMQHRSRTEQASCFRNKHESPQQYGSKNNVVGPGEVVNNDASDDGFREIQIKLESGEDCVKDPMHDVSSPISILPLKDVTCNAQEDSDHKDPMVSWLSQDCHETNQCTVLESALPPTTNSETRNGISEVQSDRGCYLELLPRVENSLDLDDKGGLRKQNFKSRRVAETAFICANAGVVNDQHRSGTELFQASPNINKHEVPLQHGCGKNVLEDVEFRNNETSDDTVSEKDSKLESVGGSLESGAECGMEPVMVVGQTATLLYKDATLSIPDDSDHKELTVNSLPQDCCGTSQSTVLKSALQPETTAGIRNMFSEIEGDKSTEMEMPPEAVHYPNVNVPYHADAALVNNQHGSNNEQSSVSCNSNENTAPQEHESRHYMPSGMEFGNDDANYDPVRDNKRLWSILTAGLQRLKKAKPQ